MRSNPAKPIILGGIVLIILGALALTYHGITYTTRQKGLQIGPLDGITRTEKIIPLPRSLPS